MAVYVKVADAVDLPPGQAIAVTGGDKRLALFSVDGTVVAIDDTCTHRGGPLSEGELKDGIVTCPWHGAQFNVKDGQVLRPPAPKRVSSSPGGITDGAIQGEVKKQLPLEDSEASALELGRSLHGGISRSSSGTTAPTASKVRASRSATRKGACTASAVALLFPCAAVGTRRTNPSATGRTTRSASSQSARPTSCRPPSRRRSDREGQRDPPGTALSGPLGLGG